MLKALKEMSKKEEKYEIIEAKLIKYAEHCIFTENIHPS